ncbi:MAG TPA: metallophosphoesterase, partial [Acidobacteriaceae bacterium]|nr:metallophosphoesterase [Acidobacteriaceae bacterium]
MPSSSSRMYLAAAVLMVAVRGSCAPVERHGPAAKTEAVVMLSDLHLDPFRDAALLPSLREAPVSEWAQILSRPAAPTEAAVFDALQKRCQVRGADSSWALLERSLAEAKRRQPKPLFVTVSGDLLAHGFPCRFRALAPKATGEDLSAFSAKTMAFLALQLRATFPGAPVYVALGNNDSGCADYRETPDSGFLRATATILADNLHDAKSRAELLSSFAVGGDYSV